MKIINALLFLSILSLSFIKCNGQAENEIQARKIKIITSADETILTKSVLLGDSGIVYVCEETEEYLSYEDIDYIYIKEGGSYPKLLMYCTLFGLGYGIIWGLVSIPHSFIENIAIGLTAGVISSLILTPFITKSEKLVYYKGKWNDSKYIPT